MPLSDEIFISVRKNMRIKQNQVEYTVKIVVIIYLMKQDFSKLKLTSSEVSNVINSLDVKTLQKVDEC